MKQFIMYFLVTILLVSCNTKLEEKVDALESRIKKLETKIASLENLENKKVTIDKAIFFDDKKKNHTVLLSEVEIRNVKDLKRKGQLDKMTKADHEKIWSMLRKINKFPLGPLPGCPSKIWEPFAIKKAIENLEDKTLDMVVTDSNGNVLSSNFERIPIDNTPYYQLSVDVDFDNLEGNEVNIVYKQEGGKEISYELIVAGK